jgi:hypothetical protein
MGEWETRRKPRGLEREGQVGLGVVKELLRRGEAFMSPSRGSCLNIIISTTSR